MKHFASLLIITGILGIILCGAVFYQRNNPSRLSFDVSFPQKRVVTHNAKPPKRIIIPKINVDLPLISSDIKNGKWETTMQGISYLRVSPIPGQTGNSVLYGHNFDSLFGQLPRVAPGDVVEIEYADHTKKDFIIHYTQVVTPKQIDVIKPTTDTRITLYTCTGFLDSKRFIVVAMPKV